MVHRRPLIALTPLGIDPGIELLSPPWPGGARCPPRSR